MPEGQKLREGEETGGGGRQNWPEHEKQSNLLDKIGTKAGVKKGGESAAKDCHGISDSVLNRLNLTLWHSAPSLEP
jgi:hypothetical protein